MRALLVTLSGDVTHDRVVYGEEVKFIPAEPSRGPNGIIDLIIGTQCDADRSDFGINSKQFVTYIIM